MATNLIPRISWDSNCFIAVLSGEAGRAEICSEILHQAERGDIELHTSYIALVETVRITELGDAEAEDRIQRFFDSSFINKVVVGEEVAHESRRLQRITNLRGLDAVHLATALLIDADVLHTYDTDLLRLDCDALGLSIRIEEPR